LFVIGFNRGAANSNFAAIGHPGVIFDSVMTLTSGGVTGGRDLVSNQPITLPAGVYRVWQQREYTPQEIRYIRD